jgi:hypothetical protein
MQAREEKLAITSKQIKQGLVETNVDPEVKHRIRLERKLQL